MCVNNLWLVKVDWIYLNPQTQTVPVTFEVTVTVTQTVPCSSYKLLDWSCCTAPSDSGSGLEEELDALSDQETRTPAESTACLRTGCECSLCARLYLSLQPWYWHSPMRLCTTFPHSHRLASTDFVHFVVFEQTSKVETFLFLNEMMELYFHVFESFNFLWDKDSEFPAGPGRSRYVGKDVNINN